ncbi:MAG: hypothetical protein JXB42_04320 [Deltaproteobacteria bacterium]|nr:hypothetical protein [Deltaproteobacteria bacterium]
MAKCWLCQTRNAKRYCSPIENILCPICCAKSRLINIDCNEDCRYLEGVTYQKGREEEKEFSKRMESVPHSQDNDIFQDMEVALMAGEIETFIRDIFINENIRITDKLVYESYKKVYKKHFKNEPIEEDKLDRVTKGLLQLFDTNIEMWENDMERNKIGQVFLRLMISIKNMSGGSLGEFGYLNYLKNNFTLRPVSNQIIVEDKFGNITTRSIKKE